MQIQLHLEEWPLAAWMQRRWRWLQALSGRVGLHAYFLPEKKINSSVFYNKNLIVFTVHFTQALYCFSKIVNMLLVTINSKHSRTTARCHLGIIKPRINSTQRCYSDLWDKKDVEFKVMRSALFGPHSVNNISGFINGESCKFLFFELSGSLFCRILRVLDNDNIWLCTYKQWVLMHIILDLVTQKHKQIPLWIQHLVCVYSMCVREVTSLS